MTTTITILLSALISLLAHAEIAGFSDGSLFTPVHLSGDIHITCSNPNGHNSTIYRCQDSYFSPATHSKFVIDSNIDADTVVLKAYHQDSSTTSKNGDFIPEAGQSKKAFNLWVRTVFQKPLLKIGQNIVEYSLYKKDVLVESGEFKVNTTPKTDKRCRRESYVSSDLNDCNFPSLMCARYFREQNYCN